MPLLTTLIKHYNRSDLHLDQEDLQLLLPPASAVSSGPSTASVIVEDCPCSFEAILWWTSSGLWVFVLMQQGSSRSSCSLHSSPQSGCSHGDMRGRWYDPELYLLP